MPPCTDPSVFSHETRIVIVRPDDMKQPYLRETIVLGRRGKKHFTVAGDRRRVVAYAEVCSLSEPRRRMWYLASHDPYQAPDQDSCPSEGVEPSSIKAGFESFPALQSILARAATTRALTEEEQAHFASCQQDVTELQAIRDAWKPEVNGTLRPVIDGCGALLYWSIEVHCPWCHKSHWHGAGMDGDRPGFRAPDCLDGADRARGDYDVRLSPTTVRLAAEFNARGKWTGWPFRVIRRRD